MKAMRLLFGGLIFFGATMAMAQSRQVLSLDGTWRVTRLPLETTGMDGLKEFHAKGGKTIDAQVPGEIHLDLVRAGEMQDPSVGTNSRKDRWPERFSWWYRSTFTAPAGFAAQDKQELVFDGLDYDAQVYLNGKLIGTSRNALVPIHFDVRGAIKNGANDLVVRLTSGYELINEVDPDYSGKKLYFNRENFPARRNLRKAPYTSGWDWCDTLPNIGMWRNVRLEGRSRAAFNQVRLDTRIEGKQVSLVGAVSIDNLKTWRKTSCSLAIELDRPSGTPISFKIPVALEMGQTRVPVKIDVPDPQLWWPNGYGLQPLYKLKASLEVDGVTTDATTQTIGLRTVRLDQSPLKDGTRFCFVVNGKPIFVKGGNWAPAFLIAAQNTPANYKHFIQAAKDAHFNMFRVNGVGVYEDDSFYEACDEAGILLWQEFAYSCTTYDDKDPAWMGNLRTEAQEFVKRVASHPSVALWCGCNECLWMYAGDQNAGQDQDVGLKIYFEMLPSVLKELDPRRPYIPGSPCGGSDQVNSELGGDIHWWYQVFMSGDPAKKMDPTLLDTSLGRFVSEYGIIGPPPVESMREYLSPEELNPNSLAWQIHTNSYEGDHRGFTESATRHHFLGDGPMTIDEFSLYGGLYQAMMQQQMMEASRFRMNDKDHPCDGNMMWSYNDCWGEIGWSIIDHFGRLKPSYYAVKRAASPLKVIVRSRNGAVVTRVVNDLLESRQVQVTYGWYRVDGSKRDVQTKSVRIAPHGMLEIAREDLKAASKDPKEWIYAASMKGSDGQDDASIWRLTTYRDLDLPKPKLTVKIEGDALTVISNSYAVGVHASNRTFYGLSDDYFDLLPGVPHRLNIVRTHPGGQYDLTAAMPFQR